MAKQLSGYRSSLSESSDTHCTEIAPKKRKTPNQPRRSETEAVMDTREVTPVHTHSRTTNSVATTADQGRFGEMQVAAVTAASSTLGTCCKSATAFANHGRPEEMQGGVAAAASSTLVSPRSSSAAAFANQSRPGEMQDDVASAFSSTLVLPCSNSASAFANQGRPEETQVGVTSATLSTLVTSCNNSAATTACIDGTDEMQDEITSTPTSNNFQVQNAGAFTDEKMFSSSDEDGEGMDWEPTVAEILEVHSPVECDFETDNEFENVSNNEGGSEDRCLIEDDPRDMCYSCEPPGNSSTDLPKKIDAEMVSTALTAVSDSDSSEDDLPLSLLCKASSLVNKTNTSVKRNRNSKEKEGRGIKKSRDSSQSDGENVEDSISRSEETVAVLPPVGLKAFCNNNDIREGVNALESTDFPGMDDVLQVIIEEEERELDDYQCETRFENEEVNVEEGYVDANSPDDASEGRNAELINSKKQVRHSPMKDINPGGRCEGDDNLRLACESHGKTNNIDGALLDEEDVLGVDSFNDVTNDYANINTDEEGGVVLEQQRPASDSRSPKTRDARDKGIDKQGCSKGSTRDTRKVDKSRGFTRDQGGSDSQETRDGNGDKEGRTSPDCTAKVNHAEDLRSSVEITNNRDTEDGMCKTLTQSTSKTSRQKNKKTVSAKRPVDKGSSCNPAKPAVPSTAKSRGKKVHRVNGVNGNNLEENDVGTEGESSQNIEKPVKDEPSEDVSKAKFRNRSNIFACDLQTLELLWNFKGR